MNFKKILNRTVWTVLSVFLAMDFILLTVGGVIAQKYYNQINNVFGINPYETVDKVGDSDEDAEYYKSDYYKEDGTYDHEKMRENSLSLALEVATEGSVLLWNDDALPLKQDAKVNLFGVSSVNLLLCENGSGRVNPVVKNDLKKALEANGVTVNSKLFSAYKLLQTEGYTREETIHVRGGDNDPSNQPYKEAAINEAPFSKLDTTKAGNVTSSLYEDAAIMIITRMSGEDQDTFKYYGDKFKKDDCFDDNYMDLSANEADVLNNLKTLKSQGKIKKIVLLINCSNAMQFKNIKNYDIDACMWVGTGGNVGYEQIANLLTGKANPSGKLPDTYVYDSFSAPATENFGDFTFSEVGSGLPAEEWSSHNQKYLVYQEGIYVGYRYYETRYADSVLNPSSNANGTAGVKAGSGGWKYQDEVAYSFGHGLSYTTFAYSDYSVKKVDGGYEVSVKITNTGLVAGKEVFQIYLSKPYTEYDKNVGIEKAAVELVGFAKTKLLAPEESQKLTVTVDEYEFKTYDTYGKGTYILEKGDYYLATGTSSHDALNNILALQGKTVSDGMTYDGISSLASKVTVDKDDYETYSVSPYTGEKIENQFADADVNLYSGLQGQTVTYLSRKDWQNTYPSAVDLKCTSQEMIADMQYGKEVEDDGSVEMPKFGVTSAEYGQLSLIMLKDYDFDNELWDVLLDQLTWEDACALVADSDNGALSVGLKGLKGNDGPFGIWAGNLDGQESQMCFPSLVNTAATFNSELVNKMGNAFGMEVLHLGYNVIYGPGANIHRSASFSGRNAEYYSEDGFLSGKMLAAEVSGIQSKGVIVSTKHFTLNEQETNRYGVTVWANEQTIRELYLKSFEAGFTEGNMNGAMTSFSRIGCTWVGRHQGLLTNVCRNEWGFKGTFITDACCAHYMFDDKALANGVVAGQDTWLFGGSYVSRLEKYKNNAVVANGVRNACHRILYTRLHSNVMNGVTSTSEIIKPLTWWETVILVLQIVFGVLLAASITLAVLSYVAYYREKYPKKTVDNDTADENASGSDSDNTPIKNRLSLLTKTRIWAMTTTVTSVILVVALVLSLTLGGGGTAKPPVNSGSSGSSSSASNSDVDPDPAPTPTPTTDEYVFEAENAKLQGGSKGSLSIENSGLKGETFVGNLSDNVGASISFKIISDKDVTVDFYATLSKAGNARVVTDFVVILVNEDLYDSDGTVEALVDGEQEWFSFYKVDMGKLQLQKGDNVIEFAMYNGNVGFSMDSITLATDQATLTAGTFDSTDTPPVAETDEGYIYEAENAQRHSSLSIDEHEKASGGKAVGHISDMANDNPGVAYVTFTVTAEEACEALLKVRLSLPEGSVSKNAFTITVNGTVITLDKDYISPDVTGSPSSWFDYAVCSLGNITLNKGANEIKFVINSGATCNMDYVSLETSTVLDGVKK